MNGLTLETGIKSPSYLFNTHISELLNEFRFHIQFNHLSQNSILEFHSFICPAFWLAPSVYDRRLVVNGWKMCANVSSAVGMPLAFSQNRANTDPSTAQLLRHTASICEWVAA